MGEIKITRCLKKCGKQWRPKQGKLEWQKQKKEEKRKEEEKAKKGERSRSKESSKEVEDLE